MTRHILKMRLSMGFRSLISLLPAIQATRLLVLTWVGLIPTERASLRWTHNSTCITQILAIITFDTRPSAEPVDRLRAAVAQGESAAHSGRRLKNSGSANAAREIASG